MTELSADNNLERIASALERIATAFEKRDKHDKMSRKEQADKLLEQFKAENYDLIKNGLI